MVHSFSKFNKAFPGWLDLPSGFNNEGKHFCEILYAAWGRSKLKSKMGTHLIVLKDNKKRVVFVPWYGESRRICDELLKTDIPVKCFITVKNDAKQTPRLVEKLEVINE